MKIEVQADPVLAAGQHIERFLTDRPLVPLLFLTSGGSSFNILSQLDPTLFGARATLGVIDERVERGPANNFYQLRETEFFKASIRAGSGFIDTELQAGEAAEELAVRFEQGLRSWVESHPDGEVLVTMGIGLDGHTAGLFAYPEGVFADLYRSERWVSAVEVGERNPYPSRVATTETFLRRIPTKTVSCVESEEKRSIVKEFIDRTEPVSRLPAMIIAEMADPILFVKS